MLISLNKFMHNFQSFGEVSIQNLGEFQSSLVTVTENLDESVAKIRNHCNQTLEKFSQQVLVQL